MVMELRPLSAADLPVVATWLARPHLAEWWDGPIALESGLRQRLAVLDGEPIGYLQSYQAVACHGDGWWPEITDPGVHGIDQFLAGADKLGQGLGPGDRLEVGQAQLDHHGPGHPAARPQPLRRSLRQRSDGSANC